METARADYGLDAPGVIRNLAMFGGALVALGGMVLVLGGRYAGLSNLGFWPGASMLAAAGLMLWSSRSGKRSAAEKLVDGLGLEGGETVLDVGCGHGLLLITAARALTTGRALGLDLWSQVDQHDNRREATLANAAAEGVADRVEVHDGDMRELPFGDASVDAVVSSLAIHNVPGRDARRKALTEIARVLKPGGQVALLDIAHVHEYAADLEAAGLTEVAVSGPVPTVFPLARVVRGRKPAAG